MTEQATCATTTRLAADDTIGDLPNMPPAEEPERVRRDLAAAFSNSGNA